MMAGGSDRIDHLTLVLMAGLPGTGKSTLSLAVGRALGWPVVDKDIFDGLLRTAGISGEAAVSLAYTLMFALARDLLSEQRLPVILDCPAAYPARVEEAGELARSAGARLKVILCLADRDTRNERMARPVPCASREWRHPARRRPSDVEGDGREQFHHLPPGAFLVRTTRPQAELVADVVAYLRDGGT